MTNDEILAALENARMDLERALETLSTIGETRGVILTREPIAYIWVRIEKLKEKTNEC